jgi:hypothetical protein
MMMWQPDIRNQQHNWTDQDFTTESRGSRRLAEGDFRPPLNPLGDSVHEISKRHVKRSDLSEPWRPEPRRGLVA